MPSIRKIPANMPIMPAKCSTCPFGPDGDHMLRARIESQVFSASQLCHHPALSGKRETHLCRGSRDYQLMILNRMGLISEPTDEAFAKRSVEILNRQQ